MSVTVLAGILSTGLAVYSGYPYIRAILNGKTKPHRLGWLVFTIMNGMVFFAQYFEGGRVSTLISLTFFIYSMIAFVLSLSRGTNSTSKADIYLFIFAVVAMAAWALTRDNALAIWLTLFIDLAASLMIILKVRKHPDSEDATPWIIGTLAYVFSCVTLYDVDFGVLYVRPIYGLVCDAAIVLCIYTFNRRRV